MFRTRCSRLRTARPTLCVTTWLRFTRKRSVYTRNPSSANLFHSTTLHRCPDEPLGRQGPVTSVTRVRWNHLTGRRIRTYPDVMTGEHADWRLQGKCTKLPTDESDKIFFPGPGGKSKKAKEFCKSCPVISQCLS